MHVAPAANHGARAILHRSAERIRFFGLPSGNNNRPRRITGGGGDSGAPFVAPDVLLFYGFASLWHSDFFFLFSFLKILEIKFLIFLSYIFGARVGDVRSDRC